jgi:protein TonB
MKQLLTIALLLLTFSSTYGQKPKSDLILMAPNTSVSAEPKEPAKVVEQMPRFPGCEDITDEKERTICAQTKLLQYVYANLKYPQQAKKDKIEGTVYSQFKIMEDGILSDIKITRDIGGGCGDAVIDLLNQMNEERQWIPGMQMGEPVSVQFTLPVRFKL